MPFSSEIETHLTLENSAGMDWPRLEMLAKTWGWKLVHIELSRGKSPAQPMLTRQNFGTLESELEAAQEIFAALEKEDIVVCRVKIEVPPFVSGVPQTSEAATRLASCYFELHLKLLLPPHFDDAKLISLTAPHNAHLSRNARRVRSDGKSERFVTQRVFGEGAPVAHEKRLALEAELKNAGFEILEIEAEWVIYDSNFALDAGWMEANV